MKVGVLALQGDFSKHIEILQHIGVQTLEIRKPQELEECDGLILPGGESTTILQQMNYIGLTEKIQQFAKKKPLFGTCAGLIIMAKEIIQSSMRPFGILDISVERNAFGRQAESFETEISTELSGKTASIPAVFIRAPRIRNCSDNIQILAKHLEEPVLIQQGHHLGATFHPELTSNETIHRYFLSLVKR